MVCQQRQCVSATALGGFFVSIKSLLSSIKLRTAYSHNSLQCFEIPQPPALPHLTLYITLVQLLPTVVLRERIDTKCI
jgi:hypothetical protein